MPEDTLEHVMVDFSNGKYDVLVCTTIIESGLDIPNVNTIVVDRADRLGLAQLYQLRGRVGRGANRAYAYFLYPRGRQLSEIAEKRLRTIFEATELGSGFRIAMKDLEIRGAGNLLGPEQHGHVAAVGFDLYCQLLAEAVKRQKGEEVAPPIAVSLDLPLDRPCPEPTSATRFERRSTSRLADCAPKARWRPEPRIRRHRFGPLPAGGGHVLYPAGQGDGQGPLPAQHRDAERPARDPHLAVRGHRPAGALPGLRHQRNQQVRIPRQPQPERWKAGPAHRPADPAGGGGPGPESTAAAAGAVPSGGRRQSVRSPQVRCPT